MLKRAMLNGRFYATYYYASAVHNVLVDRCDYLTSLEAFYGDGGYLVLVEPFRRRSAFHAFIEFIIDGILADEPEEIDVDERKQMCVAFEGIPEALEDLQPTRLPIEDELSHYGIEHESFADWLADQGKSFAEAEADDVSEYYQDLRLGVEYERLMEQSTDEVFHILFQSRQLLLLFNEMLAGQVEETAIDGLEPAVHNFFARDGVLKRVGIPSWVKRAVFFRERGLCALCAADLSGLLSIGEAEHYDHIIPLARGGLNDVTNIQLLCAACNSGKRGGVGATSTRYEAWYGPN